MSIEHEYAERVCQFGNGSKMCRYLAVSQLGFECLKHTDDKEAIDLKCATGVFVNTGDNCFGVLTALTSEEVDECRN